MSKETLLTIAAGIGFAIRGSMAGPTIDVAQMTPFGGYTQGYDPSDSGIYGELQILGEEIVYHLSDGTQWESGAGSSYSVYAGLDHIDTTPNLIRYMLDLPTGARIFEQTNFDSGDHSAQGKLVSTAPLMLEAIPGTSIATMNGYALLVSNEMTGYGKPRFNFFSAAVGEWVPFHATYTLQDATWNVNTFETSFQYGLISTLDFAHAIPEPTSVLLFAMGFLALWRCMSKPRNCPKYSQSSCESN